MDEFEIIRQYFDRESADENVLVGIGDDGAVTRPSAGRDLVTVIDTIVSGVHFPSDLSPADIGYRAVAVNLSDMAAMAATPRWMTLALTLNRAEPSWLEGFAQGLFSAADEYDVILIGGDTTRGNDVVVTVQLTGEVEAGAMLLRSGASAGDSIYVTGTIGDAAAGLSVLQSGAPQDDDSVYLVNRFARPKARVCAARNIAHFASAAIDLSDGLFTDIGKLLMASGVSGRIELNRIPLSPQLRRTMATDDALRAALGGGDDYELCFTTAATEDEVDRVSRQSGVAMTCIGVVESGAGLRCTLDGRQFDYHDEGYLHFH